MDTPSASVRGLARRLLAIESARDNAHGAERVWEKLLVSITLFAGADAFTSLLRRALTLARTDVPSLQSVTLKTHGSLDALAVDARTGGVDAVVAITAHLLGLLVTFIGAPHMLRLVREAWPDASLDE